jgi:threonine dehydrogenase-like Zn-dependent dehydrogenase
MKALVMTKPFAFVLEERETPKPDKGEVLVRIKAVGICGTDHHAYMGKHPVVQFPHVAGHEMAGEIVAVGAGVKTRRAGERVVIEPVRECGTCYSCRIGFPHNCTQLAFKGIHTDGGFLEFMAVPGQKVYPIPADMPFSMAALAEPLGIGLEAAEIAQLIDGDTVAVLGAGPIGLACLIAAKRRGHRTLITDVLDACLERANRLGADRCVNVKSTEMTGAVMDFTQNQGANVVMECAGQAANFHPMLEAASICGRVVLVGLILEEVSYAPFIQIRKHLQLLATRNSNKLPDAIALLKERGEEIETLLVTHRFPFMEVQKAFEAMSDPKQDVCKVILEFP